MQRGDEVEDPAVPGMRPGGAANVLQMQKPENIEPVIDTDHDNIAATREIAAIGDRAVSRTIGKSAAMQPHHDRPLVAVPQAGTPDIQRQAILRFRGRIRWAEKRFEFRTAL